MNRKSECILIWNRTSFGEDFVQIKSLSPAPGSWFYKWIYIYILQIL